MFWECHLDPLFASGATWFFSGVVPHIHPGKIQAAHVEVPGKADGLSPMNEVRGVSTLRQAQGRAMNSDLGFGSVRTFNKGV